MPDAIALFPFLLGDRWNGLPPVVKQMHAANRATFARGRVDVRGDRGLIARAVRACLHMPAPGNELPIEVEIRRDGCRERWLRKFPDADMVSMLQPSRQVPGLFEEQLGFVHAQFALAIDRNALRWEIQRARAFGVPLPTRWFAGARAHCGEKDGRYIFHIAIRLPVMGLLVGYTGWLEITRVEPYERAGNDGSAASATHADIDTLARIAR